MRKAKPKARRKPHTHCRACGQRHSLGVACPTCAYVDPRGLAPCECPPLRKSRPRAK